MRHSLSLHKPKTRSTPGLRQCHHCGNVYHASAKWCPRCFDADGQARTAQAAAVTLTVQVGQQLALHQPVQITGGALFPVGTVATVTKTRTWQGNIMVITPEGVELTLAPTYFIPQPSTVTA